MGPSWPGGGGGERRGGRWLLSRRPRQAGAASSLTRSFVYSPEVFRLLLLLFLFQPRNRLQVSQPIVCARTPMLWVPLPAGQAGRQAGWLGGVGLWSWPERGSSHKRKAKKKKRKALGRAKVSSPAASGSGGSAGKAAVGGFCALSGALLLHLPGNPGRALHQLGSWMWPKVF